MVYHNINDDAECQDVMYTIEPASVIDHALENVKEDEYAYITWVHPQRAAEETYAIITYPERNVLVTKE